MDANDRGNVIRSRAGLPASPGRRRMLQSSLGLAAAGLVASPWRRAQAETTVIFNGWEGYDTHFNYGGFLDQRGVVLESSYVSSTEDMITKLKSGGVGSIDFVTLSFQYTEFAARADILAPIDPSRIPNIDAMHPRFRSMLDGLTFEGKLYAIPFTFSSAPLLYAPAEVEAAPTSWADLLQPEFKNRIAMWNDVHTNICVWGPVATGSSTPSLMTHEELVETVDFLIKLKKEHLRTITSGLGEIPDLFARGEIIASVGWEPMVAWAADKGAEIRIAYPSEGTLAYIDVLNIGKDAPNYELDHELIDHMLATDTQAAFATDNLLGIVNAAAPPLIEGPARDLYPFGDLDGFFDHARPYPLFPFESEEHATWNEVLQEYERFNQA